MKAFNEFTLDENGNPSGGVSAGDGFVITWQAGTVNDPLDVNGASVEDVLKASKARLVFFQTAANGKFYHYRNQEAIDAINKALDSCDARTDERKARKVEGTYNP